MNNEHGKKEDPVVNGEVKKVERLAIPFLDQVHYDKRAQALDALSKPGALTRIVGWE